MNFCKGTLYKTLPSSGQILDWSTYSSPVLSLALPATTVACTDTSIKVGSFQDETLLLGDLHFPDFLQGCSYLQRAVNV